ncbi:nitrite reductase [Streptomyces sp. enrichment culture]|uniref:nitrite reductase n=1 Tax=Streptomyces sp. enrichment culture TaxID=1795815 RepID=UPI003F552739
MPQPPSAVSRDEPVIRDRGDACPGALRLHAADDGFLARIRIPGGILGADAARLLADAADRLGDGHIDLTSRGNAQLRGLGASCGGELAAVLDRAGLLPAPGHERVRNVVASPLTGLDGRGRADVAPWVARLDRELCAEPAAAALSGRFLFAVDDGRGDVLSLSADVNVLAQGGGRALLWLGAGDGAPGRPGTAGAGGAGSAVDATAGDAGPPDAADVVGAVAGAGSAAGAAVAGPGAAGAGPEVAATAGGAGPLDLAGAIGVCTGAGSAAGAAVDCAGAAGAGPEVAATAGGAGPLDLAGAIGVCTGAGPAVAAGAGGAGPASADSGGPRAVLVAADDVPRAAVVAALFFLDAARAAGTRAWRVAELPPEHQPDAGELATRLAAAGIPAEVVPLAAPQGSGGPEPLPGVVRGGGPGGSAALSVLAPLGRLDTAQWRLLAGLSGRMRLTPWRGVVVPGLAAGSADAVLADLARAGLATTHDSPWRSVTACTGRPGCAKALADVRADARAVAARATGPLPVHWSGCERRCGHPRGTAWVDLVATGGGYAVTLAAAGTADGPAHRTVKTSELAAVLADARRTDARRTTSHDAAKK